MNRFVPDFDAVESVVVERFDGSGLRSFKECHRGERCFILGNGPSLQRTQLAPLANEVTFGVNGIFYMTHQCGFAPTYYVVEDNHVIADNLARIHSVEAVARFFPSKYRAVIPPAPNTYFMPTDWSFYWSSSGWYETPRFSNDIADVVYAGQTVTFMNIQLAAYMGFSEIYLVGVDYEYKIPDTAQIDGLTITSGDDDPNHFHPDYFGRGKKWHLPKLDNVGKVMLCAREGVEAQGARIVNATVGGKLELFERADFDQLVGRPEIPDPNTASHYLLARALEHASLIGSATVAVAPAERTPEVELIVAASPLAAGDLATADVVVSSGHPRLAPDGDQRQLVLPGLSTGVTPDPDWFAEVLVNSLLRGDAVFWTRSVFELSPDGESVLIPVLGRSARRRASGAGELGLEGISNFGDEVHTRWVDGRSLTIDAICELAGELAVHRPSLAVVDGIVYVHSPWSPTEHPGGRTLGTSVPEREGEA